MDCRRPVRSRRSGGARVPASVAARVASARTSAAECSQPGLPVQALTPSHGEFSSNTRPIGASTRKAASATPASRSQTSTDRHGVMIIGASMAARYSATRARRTPSGTAAPSATRPSSWMIQPTGGRVTGAQLAPGSTDRGRPSTNAVASASSPTRQSFSRTSAKRFAIDMSVVTTSDGAIRTPVSWPANSTATDSSDTCAPTSAPRPETSPRPSSMPNQNRPGSAASAGSALIAASSRCTQSRTSGWPPTRPDSGEATILRTRSWVGDGNKPAAATASATA